jgi:hypothetical protein
MVRPWVAVLDAGRCIRRSGGLWSLLSTRLCLHRTARLAAEPALVAQAKPDLPALFALYWLLTRHGGPGEVLSYEMPTYFGMLCAAFGGLAADATRG